MRFGLQLLAAAVPMLLFGHSAGATQFPLEIIEHFDDTKIVIYVQQADVDQAPTWEPGRGAPPLSIEQLVKSVTAHNSGTPGSAEFQIRKIELKPVLRNPKRNSWYYLLRLKAIRDGRPEIEYLAVLMSGKVLPAIREPDPYK